MYTTFTGYAIFTFFNLNIEEVRREQVLIFLYELLNNLIASPELLSIIKFKVFFL